MKNALGTLAGMVLAAGGDHSALDPLLTPRKSRGHYSKHYPRRQTFVKNKK